MPGARVTKGDQVDVKSILKQQAYVDKFREGEWVPLLEYLVEEAHFRPSDVDTLAKQMFAAEQAQSTNKSTVYRMVLSHDMVTCAITYF